MTSPIDLPITVVSEIIKKNLDEDVLLSKNTKIAFSRIGGVFILYLSNKANEICKRKNKSKITVNDVIEAMKETGFDNFQSDIEELLMEINRTTSSPNKKRKADDEFIEIDKKEMK